MADAADTWTPEDDELLLALGWALVPVAEAKGRTVRELAVELLEAVNPTASPVPSMAEEQGDLYSWPSVSLR